MGDTSDIVALNDSERSVRIALDSNGKKKM
jgi:hypothetical protein